MKDAKRGVSEKDLLDAVSYLLSGPKNMRSVTVFCAYNQKARVTVARRCRFNARDSRVEMVLTIGSPNYAQSEYLANCKKKKINPLRYLIKTFPKKK